MDFDTAKILAAIGALLIAIGVISRGILSIVGGILWLIGVYYMAKIKGSHELFDTAVKSALFIIIGFAIFLAIVYIFGLGSIAMNIFTGGIAIPLLPLALAISILLAVISLCICLIISAIYYKKHSDLISNMFNENLAKISGILMLVGAPLIIIFIGLILIFIAWLIMAIVLFKIKQQ